MEIEEEIQEMMISQEGKENKLLMKSNIKQ